MQVWKGLSRFSRHKLFYYIESIFFIILILCTIPIYKLRERIQHLCKEELSPTHCTFRFFFPLHKCAFWRKTGKASMCAQYVRKASSASSRTGYSIKMNKTESNLKRTCLTYSTHGWRQETQESPGNKR